MPPSKDNAKATKETPQGSQKAARSGQEVSSPPGKREYTTSGFLSPGKSLSREFVEAVQGLEAELGERVWLCVQRNYELVEHAGPTRIDPALSRVACDSLNQIERGERICILIDSPGGYARDAYQVAMYFRRRCGDFTAVVPLFAKSAATLLALGSKKLYMGEHAELGPLDVQVFDADRDGYRSALDEVQSLERLHAFALEAVDKTMFVLASRTGKPVEKLLPLALGFCTDLMRPLLEKIDTVHFTQSSRQLKEAEEYAKRLLLPSQGQLAERIASELVERYPEHGFPIDSDELRTLGMKLARQSAGVKAAIERVGEVMPPGITAVGFLVERGDDENS